MRQNFRFNLNTPQCSASNFMPSSRADSLGFICCGSEISTTGICATITVPIQWMLIDFFVVLKTPKVSFENIKVSYTVNPQTSLQTSPGLCHPVQSLIYWRQYVSLQIWYILTSNESKSVQKIWWPFFACHFHTGWDKEMRETYGDRWKEGKLIGLRGRDLGRGERIRRTDWGSEGEADTCKEIWLS